MLLVNYPALVRRSISHWTN